MVPPGSQQQFPGQGGMMGYPMQQGKNGFFVQIHVCMSHGYLVWLECPINTSCRKGISSIQIQQKVLYDALLFYFSLKIPFFSSIIIKIHRLLTLLFRGLSCSKIITYLHLQKHIITVNNLVSFSGIKFYLLSFCHCLLSFFFYFCCKVNGLIYANLFGRFF